MSETTEITRAEWMRWTDIANAACAEVGAFPGWELDGNMPSTSGDSAAHYRSAVLADLALGFDRRPHGDIPIGNCICWACWDAANYQTCPSISYDAALSFQACTP